MAEEFYAIRRVDGEPIYGEYSWTSTTGPNDWEPAQLEAEDADDPIEYELVKMTVTPVATHKFPTCHECDEPATYWGLCEAHARIDDPESFAMRDEIVSGGEGG